MTRKILASLTLLVLAFAIPPFAQGQAGTAQSPVQDWQGLKDLKSSRLLVETKQGREIDANFVELTGSKLTLCSDSIRDRRR